jgi:peptidoglycan/xylan/chitin deacetylase (PgdA/CDA1 family)
MGLGQFIYQIGKPLGGLKLTRFLTRGHPRILMYHRITENGTKGTISVTDFRKQMEMVRNNFNPITLRDLISHADNASIPDYTVVVTFDDGYYDFAKYAYPILKELGIPVTLFVTTSFVNGDLWLWPDQIRYLIEQSSFDEIYLHQINSLVEIKAKPEDAWNSIADYCLKLSNNDKASFLLDISRKLEVDLPTTPPFEYSPITWEQLRSMVGEGLDLGSHSCSHPILTKLDADDLRKEVEDSRRCIKNRLNITSNAFCYPNGQKTDFNDRVKDVVRRAGYRYAVAAFPSQDPLKDRWAINRYPMGPSYGSAEKTVFGITYFGM